ncbi:MAG: tRNA pseudouridine(55) synthase TruB [Pirellulaceae bacterium]|jgi:tRNA pseudouridine55 synthase|nr:tRNA pseudouridine(55) synthase TruB [Pirellulaceae bacterium]MDP7018032.1 tRNA pseudouridine(55) synthase TruB [Pirellulaceae bacterium]
MFGILNVYKPRGLSSRAVVNRIQRIVRPAKVGHAGTLDPLAEGVLVVCVGAATRLVSYMQETRKEYRGQFQLGVRSNTEDIEGTVEPVANAREPSSGELSAAARAFVGEIQQRPPAFSALKVRGRRAYDLARRGEIVDLEPRQVSVHRCELVNYSPPHFTLEVECGSGTYIRSLGRDIGEAVGSGAVMTGLIRTAVGSCRVERAIPLDDIEHSSVDHYLLPAALAVANLPKITLSAAEIVELRHGRFIADRFTFDEPEAAACTETGEFVAIVKRRASQIAAVKNFANPATT